MALYHFDVVNTLGQFWDDEAVECTDQLGVEERAREVLRLAAAYHDGGTYPVAVIVSTAAGAPVLTAIAASGKAILRWHSTF